MTIWRWTLPLALAFGSHLLSAGELQPETRIEGVSGELRRNIQAQLSLAN